MEENNKRNCPLCTCLYTFIVYFALHRCICYTLRPKVAHIPNNIQGNLSTERATFEESPRCARSIRLHLKPFIYLSTLEELSLSLEDSKGIFFSSGEIHLHVSRVLYFIRCNRWRSESFPFVCNSPSIPFVRTYNIYTYE